MKDQNTAILFIMISIFFVLMTVFAPIASLFIKISFIFFSIFASYYAIRQLKNSSERQEKLALKNKPVFDEFSL